MFFKEKRPVKALPLYLFTFLLFYLSTLSPSALSAAPLVIPQHTAAHFCQLFVSDDSSLSTLSLQARRTIQPGDSLSAEQIFAGYILLADGWQNLRIFPHRQGGAVSWYSAADELPAAIGSEHRKYIREVFPRLVAEVRAGHWTTADAYADRMIRYQCRYGGGRPPVRPAPAVIVGIYLLFLVPVLLRKQGA